MSDLSERRAVVVGINKYLHGIADLRSAVPDAKAVTRLLAEKHGYVDPVELTDEEATLQALTDLLHKRLPALVAPDGGLVFYFAGHGYASKTDQQPGYVFPHDAQPRDPETWLSMDALREALVPLKCRHLLLVLDCCFAGRIRWATTRKTVVPNPWLYESEYARFLEGEAWHVLTSASHQELARDVGATDHSPFAAAFLEGLEGKADWAREGQEGDGVITATELYLHIYDELRPARKERFQTPGLWPLKPESTGEYVFLHPNKKKNVQPDPKLDDTNNPWRGLDAYGPDHAELFAGRKRVVRELLDRLLDDSGPSLLLVVGASGCGKSSVVKAGLLPLLKAPPPELEEEVGEWAVESDLRLRGDPPKELAAAQRRLEKIKDRRKLLLIDPLEELFIECRDRAARAGFLERLAQLATGDDPVRVLLTLRSDFEARLTEEAKASKALTDLLSAGRYELAAKLTTEEWREVIEEPATRKALFFDPAELAGDLADEVVAAPGALPLLSRTLAEMYGRALERRAQSWGVPDRALNRKDYRAVGGGEDSVGGVGAAVHALVRELLGQADSEPRKAALRAVLLRMVSFEGRAVFRRRISRRQLDYRHSKPKDRLVQEALGWAIGKRLVVADAEYLELAHDAVLWTGSAIAEWLDGARKTQPLLHDLWEAAEEWDGRQRRAGLLWDDDPRLPLVPRKYSELNALEVQFVQASRRHKRLQAEKARQLADARRVALAGVLNPVDPTQAAVVLREVENPGKTPGAVSRMLEALSQPLARSILRGHEDALVSAAFSPDGTRLVTASRDGTARLWPAGEGEGEALVFRGPGEEVLSAAFAAGGSRILAVVGDGTAWLWDVGDPDAAVLLEPRDVRRAVLDTDGGRALVVGDGVVRVLSVAGRPVDGPGEPVELREGQDGRLVTGAAFNAAGTRILTYWDDQTVRVWTLKPGSAGAPDRWIPRPPVVLAQDDGTEGSFNAAGTRVVTLCGEEARVWNVAPAKGQALVLRHDDWVMSAWLSADGKRAVTTSMDGTARVWDVAGQTAAEIVVLHHEAWVTSAAVSADGTRVLTASHDGTAQLWDAGAPLEPLFLRGHRARVLSVAFDAAGTQAVTTSGDGTARLWKVSGPDGRNPVMPVTLRGHEGSIESVTFDPAGTKVVTASADGTARIWNAAQPGDTSQAVVLGGHEGPLCSAEVGPTGTKVVTASEDATARVADLKAESRPIVLLGHEGPVNKASFDAAGTKVVTASADKTARVWDVSKGRGAGKPIVLKGHGDSVRCAVFNAAGTQVVTASDDTTARIWTVDATAGSSPEAKAVLAGHSEGLCGAAFNAAGTQVVTGSWDGTARIYNVDGSEQAVFHHETATLMELFNKAVLSVAFDAAGTRVVTGCADGAVRVWEVAGQPGEGTRKPRVFRGHLYEVQTVAFNTAGTRVLSASYDGTARVWALDGSEEPVILRHHGEKSYLIAAFNAAGTQVATAGANGIVRLWTIDAASLQAAIRATTSASLDPDIRALYLGDSSVRSDTVFQKDHPSIRGFRETCPAPYNPHAARACKRRE